MIFTSISRLSFVCFEKGSKVEVVQIASETPLNTLLYLCVDSVPFLTSSEWQIHASHIVIVHT
jgi:hypothetical protein